MAKNRTELVAEVAEKSGKSQATVNAVLDAVFQVFESSVSKGEKITIPGWMQSSAPTVQLVPAVTRRPAKPSRFPLVTA